MNLNKRGELASIRMKALWADPAFRERRSEAASQRLRALWTTPEFVDKQLRAMVRNWANQAHRLRQLSAIRDGKRPLPLQSQPAGPACANQPCVRRGAHGYHVAVTGTVADGSLRLTGWAGDERPPPP